MTPEELKRLAELSADVLHTDEEFAEWRRLLHKAQHHKEPESSDYDPASGHVMPMRLACKRKGPFE
jgi:hypothetical protein